MQYSIIKNSKANNTQQSSEEKQETPVIENTDEVTVSYLNSQLYEKYLELQKENARLQSRVDLLTRTVQRSDSIIHEYEKCFMHGGASVSTISKLRAHAINKVS